MVKGINQWRRNSFNMVGTIHLSRESLFTMRVFGHRSRRNLPRRKMPSHLTFGCGRAACSPEKKGLCSASITARTQWNFKDIRLDTQLNKCLG